MFFEKIPIETEKSDWKTFAHSYTHERLSFLHHEYHKNSWASFSRQARKRKRIWFDLWFYQSVSGQGASFWSIHFWERKLWKRDIRAELSFQADSFLWVETALRGREIPWKYRLLLDAVQIPRDLRFECDQHSPARYSDCGFQKRWADSFYSGWICDWTKRREHRSCKVF